MVEGKSNFFGTFVLAKCGTKIKEYFKNITNNPNVDGAIRYHGTLHNYKGIHGLASTYSKLFQIDTKLKVSESDMKMLLTRELGVYDELKEFFDLDEKLADWLKEGATALEEWKFKKEDYTPKNNTPEQPIFGKNFIKQAANIIDPFFPDELILGFIQLHAKLLAKIADLIMPEDMRAFLQSTINKVKLSIDKVQEYMQLLVNWSVEVLHLGKAFLMGVANGFISLIQTLLYIISFIIDSIYGFTEGFDDNKAINGEWYMKARSIMESMEDGMDWLSDNFTKIFDTVKHLIQTFDKEALAEFFHNLYNSVVNKVKALTKYDLAYFCGSAVFEIIIGVAIAILTGGGAVAAKIAANTATKAELAAAQAAARLETSRAWLKLIGREAISTVTFGLYDFFKFITHLLDKFIEEGLKGFKSFLQFLRNLLTKSGDEVAEEERLRRKVGDLFDHLGGRLLSEDDLKLLKYKLKEQFGVELRLIDRELGYEKLPRLNNGRKVMVRSKVLLEDWNKRNVMGKFDEGPPAMIILRSSNASALTVFHEKVHMEVWFKRLPKMHIVDEEKHVFEAIFKAKDEFGWTNDELIDAYDYVNSIVSDWNRTGKKFPKLNNDYVEQLKINKSFNIR